MPSGSWTAAATTTSLIIGLLSAATMVRHKARTTGRESASDTCCERSGKRKSGGVSRGVFKTIPRLASESRAQDHARAGLEGRR